MHNSTGFTLLEILISLFLLSLLLLSLNAMQLTAMRKAKAAYHYSVASEQLHSLAERLNATAGQFRPQHLAIWNSQNKQALSNGHGLMRDGALIIFWGNYAENKCSRDTIGQSGCLQLIAIAGIREQFL